LHAAKKTLMVLYIKLHETVETRFSFTNHMQKISESETGSGTGSGYITFQQI